MISLTSLGLPSGPPPGIQCAKRPALFCPNKPNKSDIGLPCGCSCSGCSTRTKKISYVAFSHVRTVRVVRFEQKKGWHKLFYFGPQVVLGPCARLWFCGCGEWRCVLVNKERPTELSSSPAPASPFPPHHDHGGVFRHAALPFPFLLCLSRRVLRW